MLSVSINFQPCLFFFHFRFFLTGWTNIFSFTTIFFLKNFFMREMPIFYKGFRLVSIYHFFPHIFSKALTHPTLFAARWSYWLLFYFILFYFILSLFSINGLFIRVSTPLSGDTLSIFLLDLNLTWTRQTMIISFLFWLWFSGWKFPNLLLPSRADGLSPFLVVLSNIICYISLFLPSSAELMDQLYINLPPEMFVIKIFYVIAVGFFVNHCPAVCIKIWICWII